MSLPTSGNNTLTDALRLLSQPGIPKLRRTAKQKLRLKGKGHEVSSPVWYLFFKPKQIFELTWKYYTVFGRRPPIEFLSVMARRSVSSREVFRWVDDD